MSKKKEVSKKTARRTTGPRRRLRPTKPVVIVALALCLLAAGTAATRWEPLRRRAGLAPPVEPAAPQQGNLALSKEYVYAGGRLVATEEPSLPTGPSPTGLVATATSANSVRLNWAAPAGTVTKYKVERRQAGAGFAEVGEVLAGTLLFDDSGLSPNAAYLYQVRAVFAGGGLSAYSNQDLATTVIFEDDPLEAGMTVRYRHVEQLRAAVDAVRALAGQGGADWSGTPPAQQYGPIHAWHVARLREQLDPALSDLGLPPVGADGTLAAGQPMRKEHIRDVRAKVK